MPETIKKPTACKKPCPECAFRKDAASGYFGGNPQALYREYYNADISIPCHTKTQFDSNGDAIDATFSPCIGHAVAQIKSCKMPIDPDARTLRDELKQQDNIDELKQNALAAWEFDAHHN